MSDISIYGGIPPYTGLKPRFLSMGVYPHCPLCGDAPVTPP